MVSCSEEFPQGRRGRGVSLLQAWALSESFISPGPLFSSPGARRALGGSWAVGQRWGVSASGHNLGMLGGLTPKRYR